MAAGARDKALDTALAQIDRQYGKGSIMRLGEEGRAPVEVIPTGSIALDVALGIGGLPRGRVVEIYGPESSGKTTVALHAVANAQRAGGIAAFIDAEHALDPDYAQRLGVDTDALLVSQPDSGEQALEIADMLVRSGALDLIVIDSVAALVPRAEIEGEMGDSHMGLQARLMSQALRKMTGALSNAGTTAIFINQLREKIGVLFGCFSYGTRIQLADGTTEKIGKVVNQRLPVEVMSYDAETDQIVPRRVVNWFDNGNADHFLQFTVAKSGRNGRAQFAATPNHQIRTPGGWRLAGQIFAGDRVLVAEPHRLSDQQLQVILGSLMGDGNLSPNRRGRNGVRFRLGHGAKQRAYLDWKVSLLANIGHSHYANTRGATLVDFTPLPELDELQRAVYVGDGKKYLSDEYFKALTPLALAIWYLDDGSFTVRSRGLQQRTQGGSDRIEICVEAMSAGTRARLRDYLCDVHGIETRLHMRGRAAKAVLTFTTQSSARFQQIVAPYVHPSMSYKLLPRFQGQFDVEAQFVEPTQRLVAGDVLDVHVKPPTRSMRRFDIEVEGNHNYFADGVMVHNSPETTTGGRALKFYASVRLDVRRIETLKDGTEMVGNRTRVKVAKNKCVAEGTLVFDPVTGRTHRIEDVVDGRLPVHLVAADKKDQLQVRPVRSWFDQGEQDVMGLRVRGGAQIWVTPDHMMLTDRGWVPAGELQVRDRVAQPRRFLRFGEAAPVTPDEARLIGYLIGDGYVGGKTPVAFMNVHEDLHDDVARIAADHGCNAQRRDEVQLAISHRPGERNGVLALCRWAGIWGHLAPDKQVPAAFFDPEISAEIVANLVFGLFETDGWGGREQTGALRVGYATTSEQLAHQLHWLLLRWGIGSSVHRRDPRVQRGGLVRGRRIQGKLPCWEVRVAGVDNVQAFADAIPMWGPRGRALVEELKKSLQRHRGSQRVYLSDSATKPVLEHLRNRGVTSSLVVHWLGLEPKRARSGMHQLLGTPLLRRDRLATVAAALDDPFLHDVLADELSYRTVSEILPLRRARTFDLEVEDLHNFVADGVVVHNCAPPFKQAEMDIMYGLGISREGGLIDVGVETGLVRKAGAWYTYEGDQLGQGKENSRAFLRDNPDLADEIEKRIKEKLGVGPKVNEPPAANIDF
ncbi:MAG: recombinase RecA [Actinomycetota bacterium]|nr:recombinase RecA [Actinomycetota bacterium]